MTEIPTNLKSRMYADYSPEIEEIRKKLRTELWQSYNAKDIGILLLEIDRLNDLMKTAYDFITEDMGTAARCILAYPGTTEHTQLLESYGGNDDRT